MLVVLVVPVVPVVPVVLVVLVVLVVPAVKSHAREVAIFRASKKRRVETPESIDGRILLLETQIVACRRSHMWKLSRQACAASREVKKFSKEAVFFLMGRYVIGGHVMRI